MDSPAPTAVFEDGLEGLLFHEAFWACYNNAVPDAEPEPEPASISAGAGPDAK